MCHVEPRSQGCVLKLLNLFAVRESGVDEASSEAIDNINNSRKMLSKLTAHDVLTLSKVHTACADAPDPELIQNEIQNLLYTEGVVFTTAVNKDFKEV